MSNDTNNNSKIINKSDEEPRTEALRARRQKELRLEREAERRENKVSIAEKWKTHRYWLPRAVYFVLHSIWIVAMAIGGFIAWLISFLRSEEHTSELQSRGHLVCRLLLEKKKKIKLKMMVI